MVLKHNSHPAFMAGLAAQLHHAVQNEEWASLKRIDAQIATYLTQYPQVKQSTECQAALQQLKNAHQMAVNALSEASAVYKKKLDQITAQHERAKAYEMAMEYV